MSKTDDEKLRDLIADLEASVASFDERFSEMPQESVKAPSVSVNPGTTFPSIDFGARRATGAPEAPSRLRPEAPATRQAQTSLLDELAHAAEAQTGRTALETEQRYRAEAKIHSALSRAHDYLLQLGTHLNTLQPQVPLTFAIDRQSQFTGIRWQDSSIRSETGTHSELAHIRKLTFRARYAAAPLSLTVPAREMHRFTREVHLMNLGTRDAGMVDVPGSGAAHVIDIDGTIPLQLAFTGDSERARIVLRCRNFLGLGLSAYTLDPESVDPAMLDALACCLLGRSRRLPDGLTPIAFNTPESRA